MTFEEQQQHYNNGVNHLRQVFNELDELEKRLSTEEMIEIYRYLSRDSELEEVAIALRDRSCRNLGSLLKEMGFEFEE